MDFLQPDEMSVDNLVSELLEYEGKMPVEIEGVGRVMGLEVRADGVLILKGSSNE